MITGSPKQSWKTRVWALDRAHNSRLFALFDPVTLRPLTILIDGQGIVMDYPCAEFGHFILSAVLVLCADRQTYALTTNHTRTRSFAILTQLPSALTVCYVFVAS